MATAPCNAPGLLYALPRARLRANVFELQEQRPKTHIATPWPNPASRQLERANAARTPRNIAT
eukprot:4430863-Lingulodinium_polyedra.AAC.1